MAGGGGGVREDNGGQDRRGVNGKDKNGRWSPCSDFHKCHTVLHIAIIFQQDIPFNKLIMVCTSPALENRVVTLNKKGKQSFLHVTQSP